MLPSQHIDFLSRFLRRGKRKEQLESDHDGDRGDAFVVVNSEGVEISRDSSLELWRRSRSLIHRKSAAHDAPIQKREAGEVINPVKKRLSQRASSIWSRKKSLSFQCRGEVFPNPFNFESHRAPEAGGESFWDSEDGNLFLLTLESPTSTPRESDAEKMSRASIEQGGCSRNALQHVPKRRWSAATSTPEVIRNGKSRSKRGKKPMREKERAKELDDVGAQGNQGLHPIWSFIRSILDGKDDQRGDQMFL
jgi:hypothetical protein